MDPTAIIKNLNRIYDIQPKKRQSGIKEEVEALQYDIKSPKGELILSYLIETKNCSDGLQFIVPIRNGLSTLKLSDEQ